MPRFSFEEADDYGSSGSGVNFFSLKNDGDKAYVHLLGDDMNDFSGYAVHEVYIGDKKRYVNCLREAKAPITDCPFCALGRSDEKLSKVHAKLFIPVYDCDTDEVKIWERGKQFFRDLASYCSHNPHVSKVVTEIERRGKANDTKTTYGLYKDSEEPEFDIANVQEDIPEILGDIVLDKSFEDMEYFAKRGTFPDSNSSNEGVVRRGSSRDDNRQSDRRTPNRGRRDAEDEY